MHLAVAVALVVAACGGDGPTTCVDGRSIACACASGGSGAQVCTRGAYAACVCESPPPKREPVAPAKPERIDMAARMTELANAMCRCADRACADRVNEKLLKQGVEMGNHTDRIETPEPDFEKTYTDLMTRYTDCMAKLLFEDARRRRP